MPRDEAETVSRVPHSPGAPERVGAQAALDVKQLPQMLEDLARTAPTGDREFYQGMMEDSLAVVAYAERQAQIEAALRALEANRKAFEELAEREDAYLERVRALFAEDRFVPLRFTAEDLRGAFAEIGPPTSATMQDRFVEKIRAAILHLATERRRQRLAMDLLMQLPEYVAAGRLLDGEILHQCALLTIDDVQESNPFLFAMFSYGFDAWTAEQNALQEAVLREAGIDSERVRGGGLPLFEAWREGVEADPDLKERLRKLLKDHPDLEARTLADMEAMRHECPSLLEREDAAHLLLSAGELAPWLPRVKECLERILDRWPDPGERDSDPAADDVVVEVLLPVIQEMCVSIFTAERRRRLLDLLLEYRNQRSQAGDSLTAALAQAAHWYVEGEDEPGLNRFLTRICVGSIQRRIDGGAGLASDEDFR